MNRVHTFDRGDEVTIFQMHPSKGLVMEGTATIHARVPDVDEQYLVEFDSEPGETYERFVDRAGQRNPTLYIRHFNKKIGIAA